MPELLIHFAVPFALAKAKLKLRDSLIVGIVALLPDLDALLYVHRSWTHSLIVTGALIIPALALTYRYKRQYFWLVAACYLAIVSHLLMDLFQTYTPILYPLICHSIWIRVEGNVTISSISNVPSLNANAKVLYEATDFAKFVTLDAPIFTSEGFIISFLLVAVSTIIRRN